jgi:hypothetical protein
MQILNIVWGMVSGGSTIDMTGGEVKKTRAVRTEALINHLTPPFVRVLHTAVFRPAMSRAHHRSPHRRSTIVGHPSSSSIFRWLAYCGVIEVTDHVL